MLSTDYVVDCVTETVRIALGSSPSNDTPPRGRSQARITDRVKLTDFVSRVITRANIKVATLMVALVYIDRATPFLHISTELWAGERVFLGALMVAYKVGMICPDWRRSLLTIPVVRQ